jgi:hypothetical protein
MPMQSAEVPDFRSVAEASAYGSKNDKLSHSHAGFDASTDRNGGNGTKGHIDHRRCDYCGGQLGGINPWSWPPDRPTREIWLHPRCEEPWADYGGQPEDVR